MAGALCEMVCFAALQAIGGLNGGADFRAILGLGLLGVLGVFAMLFGVAAWFLTRGQ